MIQTITDNDAFDFNARDLNGDTALTIVCEYPKMAWVAKKLIANRNVDVNQDNEFGFSPLSVCISHNNLDVLKELGKRPDLKITDKDKEAAKKSGINLDEYIKPDSTLLDDVSSMASLISELEAATVAAE
jgi:ankyrin repeat protein